MKLHLQGGSDKIDAEVKRKNDTVTVTIGEKTREYLLISGDGPSYILSSADSLYRGSAFRVKDEVFVHGLGRSHRFEVLPEEVAAAGDSHTGDLKVIAPMPGTIIKVLVEVGDIVKKGQSLVIVEAMKMENEVKASGSAIVEQILVLAGERVGFGQELLKLTPPQEDGGQTKSS